MSDSHLRPPLRSVQTAAQLTNGAAQVLISSSFPAVKPVDQPISGNSAQKGKRPADLALRETSMEPLKRIKQDPTNSVVNELLGRPSQAAQPLPTQQGQGTTFGAFSTVLRPPTASQQPHMVTAAAEGGVQLTTFLDLTRQASGLRGAVRNESTDAAKLRLLSTDFSAAGAGLRTQGPASALPQQPGPAGRPPSGLAPSGLAQEQIHPHDFQVPCEQQCVPYDWVLKRLARFSSPHRFAVLDVAGGSRGRGNLEQEWSRLSCKERWLRSLQSWRFPSTPLDPDAVAALSSGRPGASRALTQRLDGWRGAFSSAYLAVRHGHSCGLYVIYSEAPRAATATSFSATPTSSTAPETSCSTAILFTPGGTRSNPQPQAIVSQSTALMRSKMVAGGLRFAMPLARPLAHAGGRQQLLRDAMDLEDRDWDALDQPPRRPPPGSSGAGGGGIRRPGPPQQQPQQQEQQHEQHEVVWGPTGPAVAAGDNTPASMLLFSGAAEVHALADYLLEVQGFRGVQGSPVEEGPTDVPVLLAPVHFENACLYKPTVKSLGIMATTQPASQARPPEITSSSTTSSAAGNQQQQQQQQALAPVGVVGGRHVLEVTGLLPPWCLTRACAALQASQQPFHADFTAFPACITLNCCPVQPDAFPPHQPHDQQQLHQADDAALPSDLQLAVVPHERAAMQRMCPNLHHRAVRSVRLESRGGQPRESDASQMGGPGDAGWVFAIRATGGGS